MHCNKVTLTWAFREGYPPTVSHSLGFPSFFLYFCQMEKQQNATPKKEAMIKALEKSLGVITTACKNVGIDRTTHYRWYNEDEEYKKACDDLKNVTLDFAESQLHKQIKEGNTTASIFLLKTVGKKRGYVERQEIQHDSDIGSKLIEWTPAKDKE